MICWTLPPIKRLACPSVSDMASVSPYVTLTNVYTFIHIKGMYKIKYFIAIIFLKINTLLIILLFLFFYMGITIYYIKIMYIFFKEKTYVAINIKHHI